MATIVGSFLLANGFYIGAAGGAGVTYGLPTSVQAGDVLVTVQLNGSIPGSAGQFVERYSLAAGSDTYRVATHVCTAGEVGAGNTTTFSFGLGSCPVYVVRGMDPATLGTDGRASTVGATSATLTASKTGAANAFALAVGFGQGDFGFTNPTFTGLTGGSYTDSLYSDPDTTGAVVRARHGLVASSGTAVAVDSSWSTGGAPPMSGSSAPAFVIIFADAAAPSIVWRGLPVWWPFGPGTGYASGTPGWGSTQYETSGAFNGWPLLWIRIGGVWKRVARAWGYGSSQWGPLLGQSPPDTSSVASLLLSREGSGVLGLTVGLTADARFYAEVEADIQQSTAQPPDGAFVSLGIQGQGVGSQLYTVSRTCGLRYWARVRFRFAFGDGSTFVARGAWVVTNWASLTAVNFYC